MALELKIKVSEESNSLIVYDCTGAFTGSNEGGYGGKNPMVQDVYSSKFVITKPDGITIEIDLTDNFPNKDLSIGYEITTNDLGVGEIESGQYLIKYIVCTEKNGKQRTSNTITTFFAIKSLACCIDKKLKNVRANGQNDKTQIEIITLSNLFEAAKRSIDCGNYRQANEDLDYLKSQCLCCGCN